MHGEAFDAFICHASEDKETAARTIATVLTDAGLQIWYDEFSLRVGDSLRQSIEQGLAQSQYGIVILSPHFFAKGWPQAELNGLFAKEMAYGKTIIPVWHNIDHSQILQYAPIIADKFAARTSDGLDRVVKQILDVIEPNRLHLCKADRVVSVTPERFRLGVDEWAITTPIVVANRSGHTLYAVSLKITVIQGNIKSENIPVEVSAPGSGVRMSVGHLFVSGDVLMLDCIDKQGLEAILVILSVLPSHQSRELVVRGSRAQQGDACAQVEICDFSTEPVELFMESQGKVAMKFRSPEENLQIKGVRFTFES